MRTKFTDKSLRNDANDRIGDQITGNSHICHAVQCTNCVIGMHGGYNQMAGNRSLHRNRCRLLISDLTDHDDIRILTENGSQCGCKSQIHFIIYLNLVDSLYVSLNRIFNRYDIYLFFIQCT